MKKVFLIVIMFSLFTILVSCTKQEEKEKENINPQQQEDDKKEPYDIYDEYLYNCACDTGFVGSLNDWLVNVRNNSICFVLENKILKWFYEGSQSYNSLVDFSDINKESGYINGTRLSAFSLYCRCFPDDTIKEEKWLEEITKIVRPEDKITSADIVFITENSKIKTGEILTIKTQMVVRYESGVVKESYTGYSMSWSSSDEAVATISENGDVIAISPGKAVITFVGKVDGYDTDVITKSVEIEVYEPKMPTMWSIEVLEDITNGAWIYLGQPYSYYHLKIKVGYEEDDSAIFISSDENIAIVKENGMVGGKRDGVVTITATSKANPALVDSITITFCYKEDDPYIIKSLSIYGDNTMYVGYSQQLMIETEPLTTTKSVIWTSKDESIAVVDQNGIVRALSPGTVHIRAVSAIDKSCFASIRIVVSEDSRDKPIITNMGGYTIVIMAEENKIKDIDPFLEEYSQLDKIYKQQAWTEIKAEYNCDIKVVAFSQGTTEEEHIEWLMDRARHLQAECDVIAVSSNYLPKLFYSGSIANVSDYYNIYREDQIDSLLMQAGSEMGGLYTVPISYRNQVNVDLGLFYNYGLLKRLGLEDPAELFNEGKWNYTGFEEWVRNAQLRMGEERYALGGHPINYYIGMTHAAGTPIGFRKLKSAGILNVVSSNALVLMNKLVNEGCVNPSCAWEEYQSNNGNDFFDEGVLMTTGHLSYINNPERWNSDTLDWEGDIEFGYVPFPYPDYFQKSDTRVAISEMMIEGIATGREYPEFINEELIYQVMYSIYLRTERYQDESSLDTSEALKNELRKYIASDASIEALLYFDRSKTLFDQFQVFYPSIEMNPLCSASIEVMINGETFYPAFGKYMGEILERAESM